MNYVLAIFLPPVALILTGRILAGIVIGILWAATAIFFPPTHILFVLIAFAMVHDKRKERDWKKQMEGMNAIAEKHSPVEAKPVPWYKKEIF